MKGAGCGATSPLNIIIGPSPFSILANELVPAGYSETICYECIVQPTGLAAIPFVKDSIIVTALPLDCSSSLADASFVNPSISYNSAGSNIVVASGYSDIFSHT